MAKIDRLGWAAGIAIDAYGVRIGIRSNDAEELKRVYELLPPGWKPAPSPVVTALYSLLIPNRSSRSSVRRFNLLYANSERVVRTLNVEEAFDRLESHLQLYAAEWTRRRVFIHAGVVGWRGRAIVIPGRSLSGKSSLVAELVRAGAIYYSDEYAVLDSKGRVHPYSKPLQIRAENSARQSKHAVEEFGGRAGTKPLPLGLVVVSKYKPGARWRPRRLTAGQGVLELLANCVSARRQPEAVMDTLQQAVKSARFVKTVRGEADRAVDAILRLADAD